MAQFGLAEATEDQAEAKIAVYLEFIKEFHLEIPQ